jgi:flagellar biosynthetic protein FliR
VSAPVTTGADLPALAFGGALVLCRVAAVVAIMPGLGEADPPATVRAGLALGLTLLIAPSIITTGIDASQPPLVILRLIAVEIATGTLIGWLARLVAMALPIAGQFISLMTGLTSVIQPDPELGAQTSAVARCLSLAAPVLLLSSGLYMLPVEALSASYRLIPLGAGLPTGDATQSVITATANAFGIGLRLAAPFLLIGTVWQVALATLSRFVPTMQAGAALLPGQVLGGMALLAIAVRALVENWGESARTDLMGLLDMMHG